MFGQPLMSPQPIEGLFHNPSRPFVISARETGGIVTIEIMLFGIAAILARTVRASVDEALRRGIQLETGAASNAKIKDITWEEWEWWGAQPLPARRAHYLHFLSPFCPSNDEATTISGQMIVGALISRVAAVAAWNSLLLKIAPEGIRALNESIICDAEGARPIAWTRKRSKGPPYGPVTMRGFVGAVILDGELAPLRPALSLAPYVQIGVSTTFGLGVVEVV